MSWSKRPRTVGSSAPFLSRQAEPRAAAPTSDSLSWADLMVLFMPRCQAWVALHLDWLCVTFGFMTGVCLDLFLFGVLLFSCWIFLSSWNLSFFQSVFSVYKFIVGFDSTSFIFFLRSVFFQAIITLLLITFFLYFIYSTISICLPLHVGLFSRNQ